MAAKATSEITVAGNLSTDDTLTTPVTNVLSSSVTYTTNDGTTALPATELDPFDQFSGTLGTTTTITVSGLDPSSNTLVDATGLTFDGTTTMQDLIDHLNNNVLTSITGDVDSIGFGNRRIKGI